MLRLTDKCSIAGIQPEMVVGMVIVEEIYSQQNIFDCVITSCTDGKHSAKSLHYVGYAFDTRRRGITNATLSQIIIDCREALNDQWDIVEEEDHLHFEFQPKVNR